MIVMVTNQKKMKYYKPESEVITSCQEETSITSEVQRSKLFTKHTGSSKVSLSSKIELIIDSHLQCCHSNTLASVAWSARTKLIAGKLNKQMTNQQSQQLQ